MDNYNPDFDPLNLNPIDEDSLAGLMTAAAQQLDQIQIAPPVIEEQPVASAPEAASVETAAPEAVRSPLDDLLTLPPVVEDVPPETPAPAPMRNVRAPAQVVDIIRSAAQETGVSESYLLGMTGAESSFNPNAKASTSSALGLHQFLDQTWLATLKKYGDLYGYGRYADAITKRGDGKYTVNPAMASEVLGLRRNARASALMAARFTLENKQYLQSKLGLDKVSDADLYAAHFLGAGGAERFLRGLRSDPNIPATRLVDASTVGANQSIFFNKGRPRTAQEVYALFGKKVGMKVERDIASRVDPRAGWEAADVYAPPPAPISREHTDAELELYRLKRREEGLGFWSAYSSEMQRGLTARGIEALTNSGFNPDPGFLLGNHRELFEGIPDEYVGRLEAAVSFDHAMQIRLQIENEIKLDRDLQSLGWTGVAASTLQAFTDPATLAAGIASGTLATEVAAAYKLGQTGSRLLGGAIGAGANLALDAAISELEGRDLTLGEAAFSASVGGLLGALLGPIGRNVATQREAALLAHQLQNDIDSAVSGQYGTSIVVNGQRLSEEELAALLAQPQSAGAAANPFATPEILSDPTYRAIQQGSVPETMVQSLRLSEGGKAAASTNPIVRMAGSLLGVDTVGKKNLGANNFSADQETVMYNKRITAAWRSVLVPAYDEWSKAQGFNFFQRAFGKGWREFNEQITDYIRTRDPAEAAQFPEPVRRAGEAKRKLLKQMAEDQTHPNLRKDGTLGGSVEGAEELKPDPYYVFRVWSPAKLTNAITTYSRVEVRNLIAGAIKAKQPTIDDDLAYIFAEAILRSPYTRTLGYDDRLEKMFSNRDTAVLADTLRNEFRFTEDEIRHILAKLRHTEPNVPGHLKHRIDLDEQYKHHDPKVPLKITDLLENNADALLTYYARKVAGRVALARQRFVNPLNNELVIPGIRSDKDFNTILSRAKQWGEENGQDPDQIKKELDGLRWMYDRIKGVPDPAQLYEYADWLRVSRYFNFARLGGQMGFAQLLDVGRIPGALGIRAFLQHSHAFRRIVNSNHEWVQKHGLDRELESFLGSGTDPLRGFHALVMENASAVKAIDRNRLVDKASGLAEAAAHITGTLSGLQHINAWMQLVVGRATAQKFANMAAGRVSKSDIARLRFLNIDDPMTDRILEQVRQHFTTEDGVLFGKRVVKMNLDQWTDLEARAHFERALFRFSRHVVQENDIGAMHRMMSNPLVQAMLQFRSYTMTAWENQLLHGYAYRDGRVAATFMWSMFTGGLVYAVQTILQSAGRSDADEFLEKRLLDPMAFGTAVFQRAGFPSLLPMLIDTALLPTPIGGIFDARVTGQPTDLWFGNPTTGFLFKDLPAASRAIIESVMEGEATQKDIRAVQRILLWQNLMPLVQTFSATISDLPEK